MNAPFRLLLIASSAILLCACGTDTKTLGIPPLAVKLSALKVCEQILKPVALPAVTANTKARDAFVKDDAALQTAVAEIDNGRNCISDVRRRYAKPK